MVAGPRLRIAAVTTLVAAAAACGGPNGDDEAPRAPSADTATAAADPSVPHHAVAQPAPAEPGAVQDSVQEARFYNHRLQSMETYDSCMRKAQAADPAVRGVLQTACGRSRAAH